MIYIKLYIFVKINCKIDMKWFATTYPVSRMILLESWKSVFYNTLRLAMVQSAAPPCPHPQLVACMPCIDMDPLLGPLLHSWYLQPSQEGRRQAAAQAFGFAITPTANAQPANDSLSLSNEKHHQVMNEESGKRFQLCCKGPEFLTLNQALVWFAFCLNW